MGLNSDLHTAAASSTGEDAAGGVGASANDGGGPAPMVDPGYAGAATASGARGGRRRAVLNETGVPQCLEKLMAAGGGDGEGGSPGGNGALAGLLSGIGVLGGSEAEWQRLVDQVDPSKDCSTVQSIQFAFDYAGLPPEEISPEEVPSLGALGLLKWASASESNYGDFIKSIWSKTIPNKAEIERGGRFTDDGRTQFKLLDEFEASLKAELAGLGGE